MAFEIDFNYFLTYFWPTVAKSLYNQSENFTPNLVWTEIYSYIKGSATSYLYAGYRYIS